MAHIAILHGWSDSSKAFQELSDFLAEHIEPPASIHLADYISLDDDVRVADVAIRMETVVRQMLQAGRLEAPFDLIVHSTGGLVAREWVARYYPEGTGCPVKRLVMLAPANHGSVLAAKGKSLIGRIAKGWNNWLEVGQAMLDDLELASEFQWDLACRDLFDRAGDGRPGPYGADRIMPFVIVGTRGYTDGLRRTVNENGSDGTVRAAAANLNTIGMTMDFSDNSGAPQVTFWPARNGARDFPFVILPDRDHSSICHPGASSGMEGVQDRLGELILAALSCDGAARYAAMQEEWYGITQATHDLEDNAAVSADDFGTGSKEALHRYFQVVVRVVDNHGRPVPDYFVEFFSPEVDGTDDTVVFSRDVLDKVSTNALDPSRRCFFIDRTDLFQKFYSLRRVPIRLAISISATNPGPNVRYFRSQREGARGEIVLHREALDDGGGKPILNRNKTHLVEIIIPRRPIDKVFKLA
jgi:pimeloyl-ACP methyl ester carboxylesterase